MLPGQGWLVAIEAQLEFRGKNRSQCLHDSMQKKLVPSQYHDTYLYLPLIHIDTVETETGKRKLDSEIKMFRISKATSRKACMLQSPCRLRILDRP